MNSLQTVSIRETREQLSELVNQVAIARKQFVITKFGKPKAMIVPVQSSRINREQYKKVIMATAGAWKHRTDIKDSAKWSANLRHRCTDCGDGN